MIKNGGAARERVLIFYTKFQTPRTVGSHHFTIPSKGLLMQQQSYCAEKQSVLIGGVAN